MLRDKLSEVFRKNPSAEDLREGLERVLSEIEVKLRPKLMILAGSIAKGRFIRGMSDIDLLVITDKSESRSILRAIEDVDVEITVCTFEEALHAIKRGNQFVIDALKNGILLIGEEVIKRMAISRPL